MTHLPDRLHNILVAIDEVANAMLGGRAKQTVSGSVGRALIAGRWWAPPVAWLLALVFGRGHCQRAAEREAGL